MHDEFSKLPRQDNNGLYKNSDVPIGTMADPTSTTGPGASLRQAAVLIPLVYHDRQWQILFIRRARNEQDRHSGQVAFPGGRMEADDASEEAAALRETHEEIGVDSSRIQLLGRLHEYTTVSHYQVTPIVGIVQWPSTLSLQTSEVARAFMIPLAWLRERNNFSLRARREMDPQSAARHPIIVYQTYDGENLWGATARMTLNLIKAIDDDEILLPASG